jgi:hypothetical protein
LGLVGLAISARLLASKTGQTLAVDNRDREWDYPIVKLVADEQSRIASAVLFKPHAVYHAEKSADGRIILVELVPAEVPTVKARRIKGRWRGADVPLKRETVAAAVRADRDSR